MDEQEKTTPAPQNTRRRKRSKMQIFKEVYLPAIIVGAALIIILILIIGSIVRAFQKREAEAEQAISASIAESQEVNRLEAEATQILLEAAEAVKHYDYDAGIEVLARFTGDWSLYPQIAERHDQYKSAKESMVLWPETQPILNLSFQILIADAQRAFNDPTGYADSYKNHYVTTEEFQKILEQLYLNDYILVDIDDCYARETDDYGNVCFTAKPLYLPAGKKPLIITQTNVCYNLYIVDSDGDNRADKDGAGFANKLIIDENNNLAASIFTETGEVESGAYDLVPILEAFIETHPDFTYKGARAILALTGFDGILGYRTDPDGKRYLTEDEYNKEVSDAQKVYTALKNCGYDFACYTYRNKGYGDFTLEEIQSDIAQWKDEVVPLIGDTDLFVFAQLSDIADNKLPYDNEKYTFLKEQGFNLYSGFCLDGVQWQSNNSDHVRMGRILVTAANLKNNPEWFTGILDPNYVLTANRG